MVGGLVAWYDASDASTFTYSSGTVVSQWNDKAPGTALNIAQATVTRQPTRSGTQNGLPTVIFDGGDRLDKTGHTAICGAAITLFASFKKTGGTPVPEAFPFVLTEAYGGRPIDIHSHTVWIVDEEISAPSPRPLSLETSWTTFCFTASDASDTVSMYYNGSELYWTDTSVVRAWITTNQGIFVGGRGDDGTAFTGEVGEIVCYDVVLSTAERKAVGNYLRAKWATTGRTIP